MSLLTHHILKFLASFLFEIKSVLKTRFESVDAVKRKVRILEVLKQLESVCVCGCSRARTCVSSARIKLDLNKYEFCVHDVSY